MKHTGRDFLSRMLNNGFYLGSQNKKGRRHFYLATQSILRSVQRRHFIPNNSGMYALADTKYPLRVEAQGRCL